MDQADLECLLQLAAQDPELASFADAQAANEMCGYACDVFLDIVEAILPEVPVGEVHFVDASDLHRERHIHGDVSMAGERYPNSVGQNLIDWCSSPVFSYRQAGHRWYLSGCSSPGHVVARVGDFLIDWTARQFDSRAPFPLVFRLSEVRC